MKSLLYMCRRYRVATVLNLLGLGVAVATFYLFMTQVIYNYTYNHDIPDYERTYRLEIHGGVFGDKWGAFFCRPIEQGIKSLPQVESLQSQTAYTTKQNIKIGEHTVSATINTLSHPGVEFFGAHIIHGSTRDWVNSSTAIIARSEALRLFGTENAVGKTYSITRLDNTEKTARIVAVSEDLPANCSLGNTIYTCLGNENIDNGREWSYVIYLHLKAGTDIEKMTHAIKSEVMKINGFTDEKLFDQQMGLTLRLSPVSDIFFSGIVPTDTGNRNVAGILAVSSIFIVMVALLNLLNFTLSETPVRIRGINTRRVMGASQASLRLGIIGENIVLSIIGIIIAVILLMTFSHSTYCTSLVSGSIAFDDNIGLFIVTILITITAGALSAIIPAWYSTSFAPAMVLKGSFGLSPRGRRLRMGIMAIQFAVAFVLAIYIGVMMSQSRYIFNSDYGFDKDEVLYADLSNEAMAKKQALRTELKQLPVVESVGFAQEVPGTSDLYMRWGRSTGESLMTFNVLPCDEEFLTTMGIRIVDGRKFRSADNNTGAYIINKTMMKRYDGIRINEPIFRMMSEEKTQNYPVVGVCDNFRLFSMRKDNSQECTAFLIPGPDMQSWGDQCTCIFVRVKKGCDKIEAKQQIAQTLQRMDSTGQYDVMFLDNRLQQTYANEFKFISQVKFFALICIIITIIGVFCLTMFETEYRRKEIAVRKVMGSTVGEVVLLFAMRYAVPLLASFAVAIPVAIWISRQWLQSFAEHTPMHWWLFPLAFIAIGAIVILTVIAQCWRVATSNPVESLKSE